MLIRVLRNSSKQRPPGLSQLTFARDDCSCAVPLERVSIRTSITPAQYRLVRIAQRPLQHTIVGLPGNMAQSLATQPPPAPSYILSYPAAHIILITINRPKAMNSLPYASHWEAAALLDWFDEEPSLRVAVLTGAGDKAFCAGQDLIEQATLSRKPQPKQLMTHPFSGFMGVSRRTGKKPIMAAVNGFALGGGFEIVLGW